MSAAESDLTNLSDVRAWLGMAPANIEFDVALQRLITGCSAFMQRYMQRAIPATSYKHSADGPGSTFMVVKNYPITRVSSVTVDGVVVPLSNISFDERTIYLDGAYRFNRGRNNIALRYTAGYDEVPFDLAQACIETVALRWRERDRIGMVSKAVGTETTAFSLVDFPKQVQTLMDTYKNVVPV